MKIICKVNVGGEIKGFQPLKVVVEVAPEKLFDVSVEQGGYTHNYHIDIISSGISLDPKALSVSACRVSMSELLLHVEICKFVMDSMPELKKVTFK